MILKNKFSGLLISCYFMMTVLPSSVFAESFHVVVGFAKPPYVIQETNSGFEIELIASVLKSMGKDVNFVYVPFGRSLRMLNSKRVDAIMTVNKNLIKESQLLSLAYINYQNVVITLKEKKLTLNKIDDLAELSVAAFQTANKILGKKFAETVTKSTRYLEVATQKNQTKLLFDKKVDALVMDVNIFRAFSPTVGGKADFSDVDVHFLFAKSAYQMAFKDIHHVALFNKMLAKFKSSKQFDDLIQKYNLQQ